jgi:type II secretory pathway component HofQ
MRLGLVLLAALVLAGCASPRQTCLRAAQAELRALDAQITESEAALVRGYRITQATEPRTTLGICAWPREPVLFCTQHTPGQRATRVDVLPAAEEARLVELRRERARLVVVTADRVAACPV